MPTLAENLKAARIKAGLTQRQAAKLAGVTEQAVSGWERGTNTPKEGNVESLAAIYGITAAALRYGDVTGDRPAVREAAPEPYSPNPRNRKRLPPRAYERVYGYLRELEDAGATHEQLDEAERVMVDGAYNKLNSRDVRERSDDEMIGDIDMAWAFIRDLLRKENLKLK